jgi:hypothetical protein
MLDFAGQRHFIRYLFFLVASLSDLSEFDPESKMYWPTDSLPVKWGHYGVFTK